jgi:hypothetical protein
LLLFSRLKIPHEPSDRIAEAIPRIQDMNLVNFHKNVQFYDTDGVISIVFGSVIGIYFYSNS